MKRLLKNLIASSNILSGLYNRLSSEASDPYFKIRTDGFRRNNYAYNVYYGALTAQSLGIPKISALEFGVAGGTGLIAMEECAREIGAALSIQIDVHGFDGGTGLPPPSDFRDAPHIWKESDFRMDVEALKSRLKSAQLHLGNLDETIPAFRQAAHAPIAAIAFDLDYYSSTMQAFRIFDDGNLLPRVMCYFDNIAHYPVHAISSLAGERKAIADYNAAHVDKIIDPDWSLNSKLGLHAFSRWADRVRIWHDYAHPRASDYVGSSAMNALPLKVS
jgi:hypothetical protein